MSLQAYDPNVAPMMMPEHESWMRVYEPMIDLAGRLSQSSFVPEKMRGNPAEVFSVLLAGHGLGLSPVQSLQAIVLISGKPYVSTEVILGLAFRRGHEIHWVQSTDKSATVRITRGDGHGSAEVTYTLAQAQAAGLTGKDNWRKMPAEMLRARAARAALKMVAPDIALGLDTADSPAVAVAETASGARAVVQIGQDVSPVSVSADPAPVDDATPIMAESVESAASAEALISSAQMAKLRATLAEYGRLEGRKMNAAEQRQTIADLINVPDLRSATDLTVTQASAAISELQSLIERAAPIIDAQHAEGEGQS